RGQERARRVPALNTLRFTAITSPPMTKEASMRPRHRRLFLLTLTLAFSVSRGQAAIFNVDHVGDDTVQACDDATPDDCSLRGAILAANALPDASTINVPAGTYVFGQINSPCTYTRQDHLPATTSSQIPLCVSGRLTLQGSGADTTIIDGN